MKIRASVLTCLTVACVAVAAYAADIDLKGVKCVLNPNGDAKAEHSVDYKKAKVFFCCENCPKKFSEDPKKFAASANMQLAATKQYIQVKCPLTGKDVNPDIAVKVAGVAVGLCCNGCKGKLTGAEGKAQVEMAFNDKAFKQGYEIAKKE